MMEGDVVTLDDNSQYILINETELDGRKYFSALQLDNNGKFDKDSLIFFEHVMENDEDFLEDVQDEEIKQILAIHNLEYLASQEDEEFDDKMKQFIKEYDQKSGK